MRAALLCAALLFAGCAKSSLFDYLPFPCPQDGVCPTMNVSNVACVEGQCQQVQPCSGGPASGLNCIDPEQRNTRCVVMLVGDSSVGDVCVPPKGTGTAGAACHQHLPSLDTPPPAFWYPTTADDECAAGYMCYGAFFDPAAPAACRKQCQQASDCGSGEACTQMGYTGSTIGASVQFGVCMPTCDVFGSGCAAGLTCVKADSFVFGGSGAAPFGVCAPPGPVAAGGDCNLYLRGGAATGRLDSQRCQAGLQCATAGSLTKCGHVCRSQTDCAQGQTCGDPNCTPSSTNWCTCH